MAITVKTVRERLQTALAAVSGWNPSRTIGDMFGLDPNSYGHKTFSIDVPSTRDLGNSRQHPAQLVTGARVTSEIRVRWSYRVMPKAANESIGSAYDAEAELLSAAMAISLADLHLRYLSASRLIEPRGEWLIGDLRFSAIHLLALG